MQSQYKPVTTQRLKGGPLFAASLILTFLGLPFVGCMCGHLGYEALPVTAGAALLAWYPFVRFERHTLDQRSFAVFTTCYGTFVLLRNVADILWFGHNPVFPF